MNVWHDIDSSRIEPYNFLAVIEIPKGSKKKYELDKFTSVGELVAAHPEAKKKIYKPTID